MIWIVLASRVETRLGPSAYRCAGCLLTPAVEPVSSARSRAIDVAGLVVGDSSLEARGSAVQEGNGTTAPVFGAQRHLHSALSPHR